MLLWLQKTHRGLTEDETMTNYEGGEPGGSFTQLVQGLNVMVLIPWIALLSSSDRLKYAIIYLHMLILTCDYFNIPPRPHYAAIYFTFRCSCRSVLWRKKNRLQYTCRYHLCFASTYLLSTRLLLTLCIKVNKQAISPQHIQLSLLFRRVSNVAARRVCCFTHHASDSRSLNMLCKGTHGGDKVLALFSERSKANIMMDLLYGQIGA